MTGPSDEDSMRTSPGPRPATAATATGRHGKPLARTLVLTAGFLVVEVMAGLWTGSLALLADAGHMLTDVGGLAMALVAIRIAAKPATPAKTYGYYRVEILAALANAVVLLVVSIFILFEAYRRFVHPPEVLGKPMLAVAVVGLAVNGAGVWLLRRGAAASLNVKGAYFEVISDALGSIGVLLAAVILLVTGWQLADPLIGAAIGLFIIPRTWRLLREAVDILLEATPSHIDPAEVERVMRSVDGVLEVHDLHIWTLTSEKYAMSAHISLAKTAAGNEVLRRLHSLLDERFGIEHTTIQIESESLTLSEVPMHREKQSGT